MAVTGVSGSSGSSASSSAAGHVSSDALKDLDVDSFLKLMISELQNQDPLNPMDNSQMLAQIGEMRQIAATDNLSNTLQSVLFGQSISNASSLIGREVRALDNNGNDLTGYVEKVAVADNQVNVYVGSQPVKLSNIREILPGYLGLVDLGNNGPVSALPNAGG
jgi:flagellar basal-body rod modification protein FlgD